MGIEKTGAHERDMRGEREHLPERPMKIVSRPLSNYLAAAARAVTGGDNSNKGCLAGQSYFLTLYPPGNFVDPPEFFGGIPHKYLTSQNCFNNIIKN